MRDEHDKKKEEMEVVRGDDTERKDKLCSYVRKEY